MGTWECWERAQQALALFFTVNVYLSKRIEKNEMDNTVLY